MLFMQYWEKSPSIVLLTAFRQDPCALSGGGALTHDKRSLGIASVLLLVT
jgi:hypothetical protein